MQFYEKLSKETENKIRQEKADNSFWNFGFDEEKVIRRDETRDKASIWRTAFIRDIDKIMHCPYYNRYADKTQHSSNLCRSFLNPPIIFSASANLISITLSKHITTFHKLIIIF